MKAIRLGLTVERLVGVLKQWLLWLGRGVRWRLISLWRKSLWFVRRRRRAPVTLAGLVSRGLRWRISLLIDVNNPRQLSRALFANADISASAAQLSDLLEHYGVNEAKQRDGVRRALASYRWQRRILGQLRPPADPLRQIVEVRGDLRLKRSDWAHIDTARIAVVELREPRDVLSVVMPITLSGRPVVFTSTPTWLPRDAVLTTNDLPWLRRSEEHDLAQFALAQVRALMLAAVSPPMITVTMSTSRLEFVGSAFESMTSQRETKLEVIIGLHGVDLADLDDLPNARGAVTGVKVVEFAAEEVFGNVLASLVDQASGEWVLKWDDDDLYGPHHVIDLWIAAVLSGAQIVGKAAEFVLLESDGLLLRRRGGPPNRRSRFLAGGTLLARRETLLRVGNWSALSRGVDQNLIARLEKAGSPAFRTHGYEFVLVRHQRGHTWTADSSYFMSAADWIRDSSYIAVAGVGHLAAEPPHAFVRSDSAGHRISLCVPNQNGQKSLRLLERCWSERDWEIVVADDRSQPPLAFEAQRDDRRVVRTPVYSGFGAGRSRHLAALQANGDVFVFADADVVLGTQTIDEIERLYHNGFGGVISSEIEFADVTPEELLNVEASEIEATLAERATPGQGWREQYWAMSADLTAPLGATYRQTVGGLLVVPRVIYDQTGGFRDVNFRGVEDVEFGYRVQLSGCEQMLMTNSGVWHLGERTFSDDKSSRYHPERDRTLAKWVPIWTRTLDERGRLLGDEVEGVNPFIEIDNDMAVKSVCERFGPSAAAPRGTATCLLDAPYAVALEIDPVTAASSVAAAFESFRNGRVGEVLVRSNGVTVGHFVAIWAANRARVLDGQAIGYTVEADNDLLNSLRNAVGLRVIELDSAHA